MDCRDLETLIDVYWDREIDPDRAASVRRHLGQCASCHARYAAMDEWLGSPNRLTVPAGLRGRVLEAVITAREETLFRGGPPAPRPEVLRGSRFAPLAWTGAMAACIALLILGRPQHRAARTEPSPVQVSRLVQDAPDVSTLPSLLLAAVRPGQLALAGAAVAQAAVLEEIKRTTVQAPLEMHRRPLRDDFVPLDSTQNLEPIPAVIGAFRTIGA